MDYAPNGDGFTTLTINVFTNATDVCGGFGALLLEEDE